MTKEQLFQYDILRKLIDETIKPYIKSIVDGAVREIPYTIRTQLREDYIQNEVRRIIKEKIYIQIECRVNDVQ